MKSQELATFRDSNENNESIVVDEEEIVNPMNNGDLVQNEQLTFEQQKTEQSLFMKYAIAMIPPDLLIRSILEKQCAIGSYFGFKGLIFGYYAAVIPQLKVLHGLSNIIFGLVLLSAVGGALLSMPLVVYLNRKIGSAKSSVLGAVTTCFLLPILGIDGPIYLLIVGLIGLGFGVAWMDVSKNAQAVLFEKVVQKPKLGGFQCVYAVGGVVGALIGGGLASSSFTLFEDFWIYTPPITIPCVIGYFYFYTQEEEIDIQKKAALELEMKTDPKRFSIVSEKGDVDKMNNEAFVETYPTISIRSSMAIIDYLNTNNQENALSKKEILNGLDYESQSNLGKYQCLCTGKKATSKEVLYGLCFLGAIAFLCDGSIGDWSGIYLSETLNASPFVASIGYSVYQFCVAVCRYNLDSLLLLYPKHVMLQASGILGSLGLGLVVLSPSLGRK